MYIAAYGVSLCGLYVAYVGLGIVDVSFLTVLGGLVTIGFSISYLTRSLPSAGWAFSAVAGSIIGVIALRFLSSGSGEGMLFGAGDESVHRNMGSFLCWLLVLLSFAQLTNGWLLFTCVPTGAIMGLVGTAYAEIDFLISFVVFLLLGTFLVVHDHQARVASELGAERRVVRSELRLLAQVYVAALCACGSIVVARIAASPLHNMVSEYQFGALNRDDNRRTDNRTTTTSVAVTQREDLSVGVGPVAVQNVVLMRVRAEHGSYWRGATFDFYTGTGWRSSLPAERRIPMQPGRGEPSSMFDPRERAYVELRPVQSAHNRVVGRSHIMVQYIYLEPGALFTDLYAAPEAVLYRVPSAAVRGVPFSAAGDDAGRVSLPRALTAVAYEAVSRVVEWSPESLAASRARLPERLHRRYTQLDLPAPARGRLTELARQITQGAVSDYARVEALREYISKTCRYNLEVEPFATDGPDVASQFLFDRKEGYCDVFATSLAVLCRTLDIPARVASGFQSGEFEPLTLEYVVRDKDRHLWTEVWFSGHGWIPFDATDGAIDVTPTTVAERLLKRQGWLWSIFRRGVLPPLLGLMAVALVIFAVIWEVRSRRRARAFHAHSTLPMNAVRVLQAYAMLLSGLARRGLRRQLNQTPREYARTVETAFRARETEPSGLDELTQLVERARYAGDPLSLAEVERARQIVRHLLREARRHRFIAPIQAEEGAASA